VLCFVGMKLTTFNFKTFQNHKATINVNRSTDGALSQNSERRCSSCLLLSLHCTQHPTAKNDDICVKWGSSFVGIVLCVLDSFCCH
jgi:hypothetical protein